MTTSAHRFDMPTLAEQRLAKRRAYYQEHKVGILAKMRAAYPKRSEKICARMKAYNEATREKREAYRRANKDKIIAQRKAYHAAHREERLVWLKAYRERTKDKRIAYYQKNRERLIASAKLRRSETKDQLKDRRLQAIYGITGNDYAAMLAAQDGVCAICLRPPRERNRLSLIIAMRLEQFEGCSAIFAIPPLGH